MQPHSLGKNFFSFCYPTVAWERQAKVIAYLTIVCSQHLHLLLPSGCLHPVVPLL